MGPQGVTASCVALTASTHRPAAERAAALTLAARLLGDDRMAEGVEDPETLRRSRAIGCDASQGFLHTPALPPDRILPRLLGRRVPRSRLAPPPTRD